MVSYYDELEIEDFTWDDVAKVFHYPCPCGDRFEISKAQLRDGDEIATCPSCSLIVRVIYDYLDWEDYETDYENDGNGEGSEAREDEATPDTSPSPAADDEVEVKQEQGEAGSAGGESASRRDAAEPDGDGLDKALGDLTLSKDG
ncbi:Diphthamide biosynthesis protein 3 [Cryptotrichosporon argae]